MQTTRHEIRPINGTTFGTASGSQPSARLELNTGLLKNNCVKISGVLKMSGGKASPITLYSGVASLIDTINVYSKKNNQLLQIMRNYPFYLQTMALLSAGENMSRSKNITNLSYCLKESGLQASELHLSYDPLADTFEVPFEFVLDVPLLLNMVPLEAFGGLVIEMIMAQSAQSIEACTSTPKVEYSLDNLRCRYETLEIPMKLPVELPLIHTDVRSVKLSSANEIVNLPVYLPNAVGIVAQMLDLTAQNTPTKNGYKPQGNLLRRVQFLLNGNRLEKMYENTRSEDGGMVFLRDALSVLRPVETARRLMVKDADDYRENTIVGQSLEGAVGNLTIQLEAGLQMTDQILTVMFISRGAVSVDKQGQLSVV